MGDTQKLAAWSKVFGISETSLTDFETAARESHIDVITWCLKNEKISEHEYLDWAMNSFQIPKVHAAFFDEPKDEEFWHRVNALYHWREDLVPLTEWEGCLWIGCVAPPEDFNLLIPYRFVLASPRDLLKRWRDLTGADSESAPAPLEMPEGLILGATIKREPTQDPSVVVGPEGLSLGSTQIEFKRPPAPPEPPSEKTRTNVVANLNSDDIAEEENDEPTAVTNIDQIKDPLANEDPKSTGPRPLEACSSKRDLGAIAITHVLMTFENAMVLLCYDGPKLKPWLCSEPLVQNTQGRDHWIELDTPSIFRIVKRTSLPYHGYVTPSPINSAFFNVYYRGAIPKHVTLVPIMVSGKMVGMLMGISESEVPLKTSLLNMEKIADEFALHWQRLEASAA